VAATREIEWWMGLDSLRRALDDDKGVFLVVPAEGGPANPMTVSWGQIGFVWSRPIFTVFVRRSRYTYGCLRAADSFTINVPGDGELVEALSVCGTKSGRVLDKLAACSLHARPGVRVAAAYLTDCALHYECRIVARKQLILPDDIASADVLKEHYAKDDPHLLVLGEIVGTYLHDGTGSDKRGERRASQRHAA